MYCHASVYSKLIMMQSRKVFERANRLQNFDTGIEIIDDCPDILSFAESAFPEDSIQDIYAQKFQREHGGRGAHFDVYGEYLKRPYLATYNLEDAAKIKWLDLPIELTRDYFSSYPEPTDAAKDARRHYSAIALGRPDAIIAEDEIEPKDGFIIPQYDHKLIEVPPTIHDIRPKGHNPGSFVKLVVPKNETVIDQVLAPRGYMRLGELATNALVKLSVSRSKDDFTTITSPSEESEASRTSARQVSRMLDVASSVPMPRSPCNLD